ncbi:MAG TPA: hypothetical protein VMZ91_05545 [Candidatus Paceibacterota bacterium]|nr:hypothetical protein [Candidatus Paceibacterota bacterium]
MPKVTKKELKKQEIRKIKKQELLNNFLFSQKGLTRKQIRKHWEKYRGKKYVITELPKYRKKLARARDEIQSSILREKYFERKELKVLKVEYGDLIPTKKKKYPISQQDYYKIRKGADIDSTIKKVFADERKKVRYILLTLKIKLAETGQIIYVSNTYNPTSFENLESYEVTALENTLEKLSFVSKYKGFELLSTHLRLIYDKK